MNFNAILFDLDGTLWEVTNETYKSVNEVAKRNGQKEISINTIRSVFGLNRVEAAKVYFPFMELEKSLVLMEEISKENIRNIKEHGGKIYQNLEEVLKQLITKYQLFIVSNTGHKEYIEVFLDTSGLAKYFVDYIAASELNISKADGISKIMSDYNIEKAVYVGDTKKDMEAAQMANIPFIQARYGFGNNLETEHYINLIEELPRVVESMNN
ncbi:MAG: HAD family hydrolase [Clostridia bacterium]|nr:HAD family hydrolase [Clostridia bacterium]